MTGSEPHSFLGRVERTRRWTRATGSQGGFSPAVRATATHPLLPCAQTHNQKGTVCSRDIPSLGLLDDVSVSTLRQAGYNFLKAGGSLPKKINSMEQPTVPSCHLFGLCNCDEVRLPYRQHKARPPRSYKPEYGP